MIYAILQKAGAASLLSSSAAKGGDDKGEKADSGVGNDATANDGAKSGEAAGPDGDDDDDMEGEEEEGDEAEESDCLLESMFGKTKPAIEYLVGWDDEMESAWRLPDGDPACSKEFTTDLRPHTDKGDPLASDDGLMIARFFCK